MIEINKQENTIIKKTDTNESSNIYEYLVEKSKENFVFFDGPIDGNVKLSNKIILKQDKERFKKIIKNV